MKFESGNVFLVKAGDRVRIFYVDWDFSFNPVNFNGDVNSLLDDWCKLEVVNEYIDFSIYDEDEFIKALKGE